MAERSLDEILAEAENPEYGLIESAFVLQRQDLASSLEELQAQQRALTVRVGDTLGSKELATIKRQIAELETEIGEALVEFRFRNIGFQAWTELARKHPPTKDQKAEGHDTNPDTHRVAALAASCVYPDGADVDVFRRLTKVYSATQFEVLWLACYKANLGGSLPKAIAARFGLTRKSTEPSETSVSATDEESPPASSSDE